LLSKTPYEKKLVSGNREKKEKKSGGKKPGEEERPRDCITIATGDGGDSDIVYG